MIDKNFISDLFEEIFKLNQPELLKITQEYYKLITIENLSENQINRILKILDLAVFDQLLDTFISKIDNNLKEEEKKSKKSKRYQMQYMEEDLYMVNY